MRVHHLLCGVLVVLSGAAQAQGPDTDAETSTPGILWKRVVPELQEIRRLEDRHDSLPRFAILRTDRGENRDKINDLLNDTVQILGLSESSDLRREIHELETQNADNTIRIAELKEKRIAAPDEALFADTVEKIDEQIEHLNQAIADREDQILEKKAKFGDQVASMGVDLTRDQLDFLLSTVVGDEVVDIAIAFHNVKLITGDLERLTSESLEDMEISRRYYGMYTVLLQAMDFLYDSSLREIDERYLVEIEDVVTRTRDLMKETRKLRAGAEGPNRAALEGNIRAQEFTLEAAEMYRQYLEQQREGIREARAKLQKNLAVAENTYETVRISGDLLRVMRASEDLFDLLFNLQVPALRPFENTELQREFEKLTSRLRNT